MRQRRRPRVRDHDRVGRGLAGAGAGRHQDHLRRAVAIYPDYAQMHYNLAVLLVRRGARDEAVDHLRRAIELARGVCPLEISGGVTLERVRALVFVACPVEQAVAHRGVEIGCARAEAVEMQRRSFASGDDISRGAPPRRSSGRMAIDIGAG